MLIALLVGPARAQPQDPASASVRLNFSEEVNLKDLSIQYYLTGPFGGFGGFELTQPDVRSYDLDMWRAGQPAKTLKVIVYCPGQRFVLISESGFEKVPARTLPVNFTKLGTVPLAGRVLGAPSANLEVVVNYVASWSHTFFGIADGAVASFRVASTKLKPDGSFSVLVPDLTSDPVVAGHDADDRGWLEVVTRDPKSGKVFYSVRSKGSIFGIPLASTYPAELELEPEK